MISTPTRVFLGCVAGALAMLMFHQTTLQLLFWAGIAPQAAFRFAHVAPFNVPMVVSLTFWGAIYGAVLGLGSPWLPRSFITRAITAGVFALLMAWFVVRPLAGYPVAFGWEAAAMLRSVGANLMWGLGFALIVPILNPRCLISRGRTWADRHLAT